MLKDSIKEQLTNDDVWEEEDQSNYQRNMGAPLTVGLKHNPDSPGWLVELRVITSDNNYQCISIPPTLAEWLGDNLKSTAIFAKQKTLELINAWNETERIEQTSTDENNVY